MTNKIEEEEDQAAESDYDDEDGEDDWEDEDDGRGGKDQFSFLSDVLDSHGLDMDGEEDEEEVDPDILADPIYQMNMKVSASLYFLECKCLRGLWLFTYTNISFIFKCRTTWLISSVSVFSRTRPRLFRALGS